MSDNPILTPSTITYCPLCGATLAVEAVPPDHREQKVCSRCRFVFYLNPKVVAATPVGMKVRAKATLLESDGKRYLFSVEAWDEKEKIAEGRHERFVVPDMERFLARAMKKSAG